MSDQSRRKLLKSIAAGSGAIVAGKSLPESWSRPVVDSVMLPAHAQTSPDLVAAGCYPAELIYAGNEYFQWPGGGPGPLTTRFSTNSACSDDIGSDPIVLARSAAEAGNLLGYPAEPLSNVVYGGFQFYWEAPAPIPPGTHPFAYTGAPETWYVPRGVTSVVVALNGAGGGGGSGTDATAGGDGGQVAAQTLSVTGGEALTIYVGGGGGIPPGGGLVASGGFGGTTTSAGDGAGGGGGGGGASSVQRGTTVLADASGGGGGAAATPTNSIGGVGGGSSGGIGGTATPTAGGDGDSGGGATGGSGGSTATGGTVGGVGSVTISW